MRFLSEAIKWESRHRQPEIQREDWAGDVELDCGRYVLPGTCPGKEKREERNV